MTCHLDELFADTLVFRFHYNKATKKTSPSKLRLVEDGDAELIDHQHYLD